MLRLFSLLLIGFVLTQNGGAAPIVTDEVKRLLTRAEEANLAFGGFDLKSQVLLKKGGQLYLLGEEENPIGADQIETRVDPGIILVLAPEASLSKAKHDIQSIASDDAIITEHKASFGNWILYKCTSGISLSVLQKLANLPGLSSIELNHPMYAPKIAYGSTTCQANWGKDHVHGKSDSRAGCAKKRIRVAVVDSGIDYSHPQIGGRLVSISGNVQRDFTNDTSGLRDPRSHGTMVAGLIVAGAGPPNTVFGMAQNTDLISLKIFSQTSGALDTAILTEAINFAVGNKARIVNVSAGTTNLGTNSLLLPAAIQAGMTPTGFGTLFVFAVGEQAADLNTNAAERTYPACWNLPNTVSVMASDELDAPYTLANYGSNYVDIAAPGTNIRSTIPGGGNDCAFGSSFAAAYVTAALARIWKEPQHRNDGWQAVRAALLSNEYSVQPPSLNGKSRDRRRLDLSNLR